MRHASFLKKYLLPAVCWMLVWIWSGAALAAAPDSIAEVKVFQLKERQVVAVALENRMPGEGIEDVLGYRLEPKFSEKRTANRLEIALSNVSPGNREMPAGSLLRWEKASAGQALLSLSGAEAALTKVTTVHRKTVKGKDGMIRLRTYLVVNIPHGKTSPIPTIVLDAGHGGEDDGAVKNFIREKDINLDLALRAARMFEERGWNVVMTRRTDVEPTLLERADAANITGADLFISIHNNSLPEEKLPYSREYGTTVLYNAAALRPAQDLAAITQNEIIGVLGTQREVLQDRPRLVVLNSTWVPAILTEGIMMPNPGNAKMIMDRLQRQRMAEAIVRSVEKWRGGASSAGPAASGPAAQKASPQPTRLDLPAGTGNSAANVANRGTLAAGAGWIYYLNKAESLTGMKEETLWRFRPDRFMSDQLVADAETWEVSLAGDWLYYVNWSDGQAIYRAKPDGSGAARLVDGPAQQVNVAGARIIYVKDRRIYSVPAQGGMDVRLADDEAENVMVSGGWIYYANGSDGFRPYRIKTDGTGRMKLSNDETLFMAMAGDWLFYSNLSDGEKLYRLKTDGTDRVLTVDEKVGYVNTDGRCLYYTSTSQGNAVFRARPDGTARAKVADGGVPSGPIGIAGGKLYYRGVLYDLKP